MKTMFYSPYIRLIFFCKVQPNWKQIIRIFNGCEVPTENSISRVTVRLSDAEQT